MPPHRFTLPSRSWCWNTFGNRRRSSTSLRTVLTAGGVFWAFTIDARHWFCTASLAAKRFGIKTAYLNFVWGKSGQERYENYPAYYRANTPERIQQLARGFQKVRCVNFAREGQLNPFLPRPLRPLGRLLDRRAIARTAWPAARRSSEKMRRPLRKAKQNC